MSKILLAESQITPTDRVVIELSNPSKAHPWCCCAGLLRRP